jgi:hypothetical protein
VLENSFWETQSLFHSFTKCFRFSKVLEELIQPSVESVKALSLFKLALLLLAACFAGKVGRHY